MNRELRDAIDALVSRSEKTFYIEYVDEDNFRDELMKGGAL